MANHEIITWDFNTCFVPTWRDVITPRSFEHPGKFARGIVEKILDYGLTNKFWSTNDAILDPFAGVGCGGLACAFRNLQWVGVELEPRYVAMAEKNFAMHRLAFREYSHPYPLIRQGDSRALIQPGLTGLLSSPPYLEINKGTGEGTGAHSPNDGGKRRGKLTTTSDRGYGVVSSPPYQDTGLGDSDPERRAERMRKQGKSETVISHTLSNAMKDPYGDTPGQIGKMAGEQFWSAARSVLSRCHAVLSSGSVTAWNVKAFVRNKKVIDFPGDWANILEKSGFHVFLEARASNVKETREPGLFEPEVVTRKDSKTMWKRIHDAKNPDLAVNYEVVWFARRS